MGIAASNTSENAGQCKCPTYSTFKGSSLKGGIFCAAGKAKEEVKKAGYVCAKCSVHSKYRLEGGIFCVKGKSEICNSA